jgi:ferric-dicitrate binding protein FerR (iron transport regulator)
LGIPPAWAWIAATIVLVTGSAVFWRQPPLPQFREYATLPGQRSQLTLLDGTRVLLSVDSRLRLPRDYGVRERVVELEGEAYFVVRHDATQPFVVRTARGTTEDLGTQFDVRAYRDEHLQVVVAEGRVVLRPAARAGTTTPLTLHPRERGVIDAGGTVTRTRGIPVARYVSWTRGVLWFHEAPLSGVIAQLGRWYDLEIAVSDSTLLAEPLTISFGPESADEALTALARVLDARVTRAGRSVQLLPIAPPHSRMED